MTARLGLPPIAGSGARTLILGSMPGVKSLGAARYYAHPRNQFWPIMARLVGAEGSYEERVNRLGAAGIALWDVLQACDRPGSLDSAITAEVPNDFATFLREHPSIERVFFNGAKAAQSWARLVAPFQDLRPVLTVTLPSTSPANAGLSLSEKTERWRAILG